MQINVFSKTVDSLFRFPSSYHGTKAWAQIPEFCLELRKNWPLMASSYLKIDLSEDLLAFL